MFAAAVVGDDPVPAALLALGIARQQTRRRRVVVGDLIGEVPPLQSLVMGDDPHGISDSFLYGISLNKIARRVDGNPNLFILPSGTEPVFDAEIFRNDRWRRLAAGVRDANALLLLVALAGTPGLEELVAMLDGAVMAGEGARLATPERVLVTAPEPKLRERGGAAGAGVAPPEPERSLAPLASAPLAPPSPDRRPHRAPDAERQQPSSVDQLRARATGRARAPWLRWAAGALAAAVLLGAFAAWRSRGKESESSTAALARADTTRRLPATTARPVDTTAGAAEGPVNVSAAVLDPADSAIAATYAVELVAANTQTGANLELQKYGQLPAVTVVPLESGPTGSRWYHVIAGAFRERRRADSLLTALRRGRILEPGAGMVRVAPYALLVEAKVSRELAPAAANGYASRGLPVYALLQSDGSARLYAGAFRVPQDAALLASSLRAAGLTPTVAYRIGESF